jgi:hypothetical protein
LTISFTRYNSAIFQTIGAYDVAAIVVSERFLTNGTWNTLWSENPEQFVFPNFTDIQTSIRLNPHGWSNLTNLQCIQTYSASFITSAGSLLAVTTDTSYHNNTLLASTDEYSMVWPAGAKNHFTQRPSTEEYYRPVQQNALCTDWTSKPPCNFQALGQNAPWTIANHTIAYCLSENVPDSCDLEASVVVAWIVVACNLVKAVIITLLVLRLDHEPLITLGDAAASFLERPDATTARDCLLEAPIPKAEQWPQKKAIPRRWKKRTSPRWFVGASWRRWLLTILL